MMKQKSKQAADTTKTANEGDLNGVTGLLALAFIAASITVGLGVALYFSLQVGIG